MRSSRRLLFLMNNYLKPSSHYFGIDYQPNLSSYSVNDFCYDLIWPYHSQEMSEQLYLQALRRFYLAQVYVHDGDAYVCNMT